MRTHEQRFDDERQKAKKYEIARNIAGVALIGFVGVEVGSDLITHATLLPDHNRFDAITIGIAHGLAVSIVSTLHHRKRASESSALKAAAYEINDLKDRPYEPQPWALNALAEANLTSEEVVKAPYGSVIKPKHVS